MVIFLAGVSLATAGRTDGNNDLSEITKVVFPSVVRVEARNHVRKVATGVVIDKDGHIVTTALISPRDEQISVITSEGEKAKAEFLGMDPETNLAVIQAADLKLKPIKMGSEKDIAVGAWIGVISISPEKAPAVTQGIVSSIGKKGIRLNVYVVPGMSGSPVVDKEGRMIGLLRGTYMDEQPVVFEFRQKVVSGSGVVFNKAESPASGLALAVPIDTVKNVSREIEEKGKVERGWLGVSINVDTDGKVVISGVDEDSPAEKGGLKEEDLILRIGREEMKDPNMLVEEIRRRKPGDTIKITVERDGKTLDLPVKLGEYKQEKAFLDMEKRFPLLFTPERAKPSPIPRLNNPGIFKWVSGPRKTIGVQIQELNKDLADYFGVKDGTGLLIAEVTQGSPAEKAGLKVGDVLIEADGKKIEQAEDLIGMIQDKKKDEKITFTLIRNKKIKKIDVAIAQDDSPSSKFDFFMQPKFEGQFKKDIRENMRYLFKPYRSIKV